METFASGLRLIALASTVVGLVAAWLLYRREQRADAVTRRLRS